MHQESFPSVLRVRGRLVPCNLRSMLLKSLLLLSQHLSKTCCDVGLRDCLDASFHGKWLRWYLRAEMGKWRCL